MYVAYGTDEAEGSQEGEVEILGEGLCDLESIDQQGDEGSGSIAGAMCLMEGDCAEQKALWGTTDSLPVIRLTRGRNWTPTNTRIGVLPRKRVGSVGRKARDPVSTMLISCKIIINS